jgi:hypothetical protein
VYPSPTHITGSLMIHPLRTAQAFSPRVPDVCPRSRAGTHEIGQRSSWISSSTPRLLTDRSGSLDDDASGCVSGWLTDGAKEVLRDLPSERSSTVDADERLTGALRAGLSSTI